MGDEGAQTARELSTAARRITELQTQLTEESRRLSIAVEALRQVAALGYAPANEIIAPALREAANVNEGGDA